MRFNFPNKYYPSDEAYLEAAGEALRVEYTAIVEAGFNLQLDSPDLCMRGHAFRTAGHGRSQEMGTDGDRRAQSRDARAAAG